MELSVIKIVVSLGVPGLALGVFYLLFRSLKWRFPKVPRVWVGPIVTLFMLLVAVVVYHAVDLWAPNNHPYHQSNTNRPSETGTNIVEAAGIRWVGGGAVAIISNVIETTRLPFAEIFDPASRSPCVSFGTACMLAFDLEAQSSCDGSVIEEIRVRVHRYSHVPNFKPCLPRPYEKSDVYYIEISPPIDGTTTTFSSSSVYVDHEKMPFGIVRLQSGTPEHFAVRINTRIPGIYEFDVVALVRYRNETQCLELETSTQWLFGSL